MATLNLNDSLSLSSFGQIELILGPELEHAVELDIYTASSLGDTEVVRRCLRRNQRRLDALNRSGWAPLHYACSTGYEHTVAFLLDEAKAHVDVEASDKTTPLMHAAGGGYERIVHRLLKKRASTQKQDVLGRQAIHYATLHGEHTVIKMLLKAGSPVDCVDKTGVTPLLLAVANAYESCVEVLLRFGANSKQCDSQGQTPRMLAERMAQPSAIIIDLLNKHEQRNNTSPLRAEAGLDLVTYASQSPSPRPPSLSPMPVTSDTESRLMDAGDDIETFLKCLKLEKYIPLFHSEEIDFATLVTMTDADLKSIGLALFGPRKKIMVALERWKKEQQKFDSLREAMAAINFAAPS